MPIHEYVDAKLLGLIHRGGVELTDQFAVPWRELCLESTDDRPFYQPEWIGTYLRAFDPKAEVVLATARAGDRWQAVLPLVEKRELFRGLPARVLRSAANEHSCRFDLVRMAGEAGDAGVAAIWEALKQRRDWDAIELLYVPEGGAAEQLLAQAALDGFLTGKVDSYRSPYITLEPTDVAENIPARAKFRQNFRRRKRLAQANCEIRTQRIDNPTAADMERFYALEASGWKGKEQTAISANPATRAFYDGIASAAASRGYFSLYLTEFGGKPVAGHFGLTYRGRYHAAKVAYDESYSAYGPGHLILEAVLDDLLRQGCREFDFTGPWMEWKEEWARGGRTHNSCFIFRPGLYGRMLYEAQFTVRNTLRTLVRRARELQNRSRK